MESVNIVDRVRGELEEGCRGLGKENFGLRVEVGRLEDENRQLGVEIGFLEADRKCLVGRNEAMLGQLAVEEQGYMDKLAGLEGEKNFLEGKILQVEQNFRDIESATVNKLEQRFCEKFSIEESRFFEEKTTLISRLEQCELIFAEQRLKFENRIIDLENSNLLKDITLQDLTTAHEALIQDGDTKNSLLATEKREIEIQISEINQMIESDSLTKNSTIQNLQNSNTNLQHQ